MAKTFPPVGQNQNWRDYYRAVRSAILIPLLQRTQARIEQAERDYLRIRQAIRDIPSDPRMRGLAGAAATAQFYRIKRQHTAEFERSMRTYFGVRYRVTDTPAVQAAMRKFVEQNVRLIVTIPSRLHDPMIRELTKLIESEAAFDEARLSQVVRRQFGSTGYNLRRIVRDQTSKAVGNLNEVRQTDAGIKRYIWSTSEDGAVRSNHRALNGRTFEWGKPPSGGGTRSGERGHPGSGIQCRCVALAIVPGT